jgi:hypothetical protein
MTKHTVLPGTTKRVAMMLPSIPSPTTPRNVARIHQQSWRTIEEKTRSEGRATGRHDASPRHPSVQNLFVSRLHHLLAFEVRFSAIRLVFDHLIHGRQCTALNVRFDIP